MKSNQRLQSLPQSVTVALADRVRQLAAEGKQVIALQTGDPDFATPEPIADAASQAIRDGLTHYANSRGLPELREAISQDLAQKNDVDYDPSSEVLVTHGGVHAYFCALQTILSPGDEVLVADPAYITHVNNVNMLGGLVKRVPSRADDEFWPRMEDWEESVSPRSIALVINSPNNPTGSVASVDYLRNVVDFAVRHDLYIISDEVYEAIVFDGHQHVCVASLPGARERTLLVKSFSKTYAMTGWRIGYLTGPAPLIAQALKVSQNTITNVAPFVQRAALCALINNDVATAVEQMLGRYQHRRDMAMSILKSYPAAGVGVIEPRGAFYLFLDMRKLETPSLVLAERLLEEALISVVPGSAYGECGEGFLRMTTATSEQAIEAGLRGLLEWVS